MQIWGDRSWLGRARRARRARHGLPADIRRGLLGWSTLRGAHRSHHGAVAHSGGRICGGPVGPTPGPLARCQRTGWSTSCTWVSASGSCLRKVGLVSRERRVSSLPHFRVWNGCKMSLTKRDDTRSEHGKFWGMQIRVDRHKDVLDRPMGRCWSSGTSHCMMRTIFDAPFHFPSQTTILAPSCYSFS